MIRIYVTIICIVYLIVIFSLDFPRILALRGLHDE